MKSPRVDDHYRYWDKPPPERSARCDEWIARLAGGFIVNSRIRGMGYDGTAQWFGVYMWEYLHVLLPLILAQDRPRTAL